ncbi:hypothetical protein GMO_23950 [Gluconobacter morbifer G707]|uniref:Uncharacterized protein n=1 Tax=Gluconobacter morbifer G707 TaxID=1088869 RepID=G6XLZ5_9PROT|nr:hypothetical protein GMO_23950 [Gluconobacter morbifer G707]
MENHDFLARWKKHFLNRSKNIFSILNFLKRNFTDFVMRRCLGSEDFLWHSAP